LTLAILLSLPAAANAQDQPPPPPTPGSSQGYMYGAYGKSLPGHHEHEGFFFRFGAGLGYTAMVADDPAETTVKGGGGNLMLAFGFNVAPRLIIYGEGIVDVAVNPTIEIDGEEFDTDDLSAGIIGAGAGLAFYTRSNLYFSGTLALMQLSVQVDGDEVGESQFGPAFSGQVGKEWWVSSNWGLGIAGQLLLASMKDSGGSEDVTWGAAALSILFSATYD
jgi:hypothetical protein